MKNRPYLKEGQIWLVSMKHPWLVSTNHVVEVVIKEFSPSGKFVCLEFPNEHSLKQWYKVDEIEWVERLG